MRVLRVGIVVIVTVGSEGLSSMELSQRCKVNATHLKVFSS